MSESEERDCCRIDASILQHKRAYCQLQSRFSRINHRDGHFREESRAKVTVLTCKRGRAGVLQACILHYRPCSTRYKLVKQAARRLPCGRDARLSRLAAAAGGGAGGNDGGGAVPDSRALGDADCAAAAAAAVAAAAAASGFTAAPRSAGRRSRTRAR